MADHAREVIERFWDALYRRDYDTMLAHLDKASFYEDVPSPDIGALGGESIVRRIRIGFDSVESHDHSWHHVVSDGRVVMIEHTETWHWHTGESATLPFVTVMEVDGDVIRRWSDYWNYDTLLGAAPQWWVTEIMEQFAAQPFEQPAAMPAHRRP
ncbi:MAG TPA: limonene-1,2-epoxide hydrolase family protein [Acidimicrobiales bacterium]|jgi:limonene-1,2-epoxide hydrolase